ncbi:MAG TPA: hypothetical protein VM841_08110 [Actinomycetota bacterium]|nr:hypothetical protein [Actinomycetota bacterium]
MKTGWGKTAAVRTGFVLVLSVGAAACASPAPVLSPELPHGELRVYRMTTEAVTTSSIPGLGGKDVTVLAADLRIEVGRINGKRGALLAVVPISFVRNGAKGEVPPRQDAAVVFDDDGAVESVVGPKGKPAAFGGSFDDIGTIFGSTIAKGPVKVAERWASRVGSGPQATTRRSRVAALRVVKGYRVAIVESAVRRPVDRTRTVGGNQLRLVGSEVSNVTTAFAFDFGLPVEIVSAATTEMQIAGAPQRGTVTIMTTTKIGLIGRSDGTPRQLPSVPTPAPSTSPAAGPTASPKPSATPSAPASPKRSPSKSPTPTKKPTSTPKTGSGGGSGAEPISPDPPPQDPTPGAVGPVARP